jgi:mitochondrial chaperone BCS1
MRVMATMTFLIIERKRLKWTPSFGRHFFVHEGRILTFTRIRDDCLRGRRTEEIEISCFGRNGQVLKRLMEEAKKDYLEKDKKKTVIYRGTTDHEGPFWLRCLSRTPRPMPTILLDDDKKTAFVNDIESYLLSETERWYAIKRIPYRRGYMFYGPPGTGKSSLAFAAAGFFKLEIYIVNLYSNMITDDGLASLFQLLPKKCIVLLEDVDAAGVTAERSPEIEEATNSDIKDLGKCVIDGLEKAKGGDTRAKITLSGLLNAIDGVASQEGRILIMTTNYLQKLDEALIRPGRVDLFMEFKLADSTTVQELFYRIYSKSGDDESHSASSIPSTNLVTPDGPPLSEEKLHELALAFSKHIPESIFTPAEIQGYLLPYRQSPLKAVENILKWVTDNIAKRPGGDKGGMEKPVEVESTGNDIGKLEEVGGALKMNGKGEMVE